MINLCQRWKELLINLVTDPENAELARLSAEEASAIFPHIDSCDVCEEGVFEEVFKGLPPESMMAAMEVIDEFFRKNNKDDDVDENIRQAMVNSVEAKNQSLDETVAGFIARHPELSFEKFGLLSERLKPIIAFLATDSIAMMLRRQHNRGEEPFSFHMYSDGSCKPIGKAGVIRVSSFITDIGMSLWESPWEVYQPTKPNLEPKENWKEYFDFRKLHRDSNGRDVIVPRLISWLFAALKVSPGLMYGYRARASDKPDEWILEPFGEDEPFNNVDKDKPWML